MPQNDFLTFAGAPGANVLTQAEYEALAAQATGFQSGTAISGQLNKVWRQAAIMSAMIASFIVDNTGDNVIDNGDAGLPAIQTSFEDAIRSAVAQAGTPFGHDTGAVNALVANVVPAPSALTDGLIVLIKIAYTNTGSSTLNLQSLGAKNVLNADGTPLSAGELNAGGYAIFVYDGTNFQMMSLPGPAFFAALVSGSTYTAVDSGSANALVASLSPAPATLANVRYIPISIKVANANTGATTLDLNSLGATPVVNVDGTALVSGQITASMHILTFDGTNFVLVTPPGPRFDQSQKLNYALAAGTANAITVTLAPAPAAIAAGFPLRFKASADNTGATTINPNGLGAYNIIDAAGNALAGGEFKSGGVYELLFDGTSFRAASVTANLLVTNGSGGRLIKRTLITTAGTSSFSPQSATTQIRVRAQGGGGAGAGTSTGNLTGGGASGSLSEAMWLASSLSFPVTVTVGAGGVGNVNASGSAGGTTSFGTYLTAPGGGGGSKAGSMPSAGGAGGVPGSAGSVSGSPIAGTTILARGNAGGIGFAGPGTTGTIGGNGGAGMFGGAAASQPAAGAAGTAGYSPGAGGSGATYDGSNANSVAGGAGAAGWIEIEEYA